jgi:heptosyltransferase-2
VISLVIQTAFIGDTVLTTPLLTELAARGAVDVVATPAGASVLVGHPAVRKVFAYDKRGVHSGVGGFFRFARSVRDASERYNAAYLAQGSLRSAALARSLGIPELVGFADAPGRVLYTSRVVKPADRHQAERLWRLAFATDAAPQEMPPLSLFPSSADKAAVDALLNAGDGRPLIALAPGSVWATKRWPYFEQLATSLGKGVRLAVVGGTDDISLGELIRVRAPDAVLATGKLTLLGSAELIRRARVLVSNDSSPTHLASAVGTPTITIFGPTSAGFGFGPLAPGSRAVQHESMPCRPCHHHGPRRCPLGHWLCMADLRAERVAETVRQLL